MLASAKLVLRIWNLEIEHTSNSRGGTMKKAITCVTLLVAVFAASWLVGGREEAKAQPQMQDTQCVVPKSWGTFKGADMDALVFEDASGTIRFYEMQKSCLHAKEVRRQ